MLRLSVCGLPASLRSLAASFSGALFSILLICCSFCCSVIGFIANALQHVDQGGDIIHLARQCFATLGGRYLVDHQNSVIVGGPVLFVYLIAFNHDVCAHIRHPFKAAEERRNTLIPRLEGVAHDRDEASAWL